MRLILHSLIVSLIVFLTTVLPVTAKQRPNILFLLADDQRPDTIAALGNDRIETPNLDALVRRGMTFPRASCSYPICVISRAEILTGMHGWQNGVDGLSSNKLHENVSLWPETLRQAGYQTWYVGKWHTRGRPSQLGFTAVNGLFSGGGGAWWRDGQTDWKGFPITGYRGWIFQTEDGTKKFPDRGVGLTADISSKFADAAIELLKRPSESPWYLHVSFTAPHDPLHMPSGYEGKYKAAEMPVPDNFLSQHPFDHGNFDGRDERLMHWPRTRAAVADVLRVYYSVIDDMDQQIGRILTALEESGQAENTLIIFSSDHGMSVGSHGLRGKQNMYEHTINVPLVICGPGIPAGVKSGAQVYLRELYPTTCELVGVDVPKQVTGRSFANVLHQQADSHHDSIFGYYRDTQRMIRTDRWKLVRYPVADRWQLFDLEMDPDELHNLADQTGHHDTFELLRQQLETWRREMGDPAL